MTNPRDVNNLLHDLQDKLMVNLDTTLRATPASVLVRAHPPPSRRRPLSELGECYDLAPDGDWVLSPTTPMWARHRRPTVPNG